MKIAISSQGRRRDAQVEPWLGKAAYFLIVDTGSMIFDALENESAGDSAQIDEMNAARLLIDAGVHVVLTSNCGFEARRMFTTAGIRLFQTMPGTVEEAVEQFKSGRLLEVSTPSPREPVEAGVTGEPKP